MNKYGVDLISRAFALKRVLTIWRHRDTLPPQLSFQSLPWRWGHLLHPELTQACSLPFDCFPAWFTLTRKKCCSWRNSPWLFIPESNIWKESIKRTLTTLPSHHPTPAAHRTVVVAGGVSGSSHTSRKCQGSKAQAASRRGDGQQWGFHKSWRRSWQCIDINWVHKTWAQKVELAGPSPCFASH